MTPDTRSLVDRLLAVSLLLIISAGCGQTSSCGCGEAAPFPKGGVILDQGVQLRITESGIEALEGAMVPLIMGEMGGATVSFCLEETTDYPAMCFDETCARCSRLTP